MKMNRQLAIVSFLLLAMGPLAFAQGSSTSSSSGNSQSSTSSNGQSNSQSNNQENNQSNNKESIFNSSALNNSDDAYTVSLGTGQLLTLSAKSPTDQSISTDEPGDGQSGGGQGENIKRNYRNELFYGASVYSVYTNSVAGLPNKDLISTSIDPYLALFIPTRTGRYLLQYSAVLNPNDTSSGGPQAYHSAAFSALGSFNPRWYWTGSASASYGSESARFQGPLSFLVVQGTPIANPNTNAVLLRECVRPPLVLRSDGLYNRIGVVLDGQNECGGCDVCCAEDAES